MRFWFVSPLLLYLVSEFQSQKEGVKPKRLKLEKLDKVTSMIIKTLTHTPLSRYLHSITNSLLTIWRILHTKRPSVFSKKQALPWLAEDNKKKCNQLSAFLPLKEERREKSLKTEVQQCIYYSMTDAVSDAEFIYSGIRSQQPFQIQWHLNAATERCHETSVCPGAFESQCPLLWSWQNTEPLI